MREILFRGKTEKGKWVQGYFGIKGKCSTSNSTYWIMKSTLANNCDCVYFTDYEVIPSTIGQYTGLTDKNGKKIFEGDIINIEYPETIVKNAVIEYVGASFYGATISDNWEFYGYFQLEVIGNIHDNPELLEGSVDK